MYAKNKTIRNQVTKILDKIPRIPEHRRYQIKDNYNSCSIIIQQLPQYHPSNKLKAAFSFKAQSACMPNTRAGLVTTQEGYPRTNRNSLDRK